MDIFAHLILLFLAAFAAYGHLTERQSASLTCLVVVLPTFGVYWAGPWALLTYVLGYLAGVCSYLSYAPKDKDLHK